MAIGIITEPIKSNLLGTIIDLETKGNFDNRYSDSRRYKSQKITVFGCITKNEIKIIYAKNEAELSSLNNEILAVMDLLPKPLAAFNALFEMGVLFHNTKEKYAFDQELNSHTYEPKSSAVKELQIPQYGDPFNDKGELCIKAWEKGHINKVIAHNKADLLKERDILLKRGCRKVDELIFKNA